MSISIWVAFLTGVISFVSPCTLPLFPSYMGYITGVSFQSLQKDAKVSHKVRARALTHALFFCAGLSLLFVALGFGATAFGHLLREYRNSVRLVGGAVVIVMGLFMAGVLKSSWLLQERRLQLPFGRSASFAGSFVVGIVFAAGWTPCVGPILASVLMMAMNNPHVGAWYMVAYALGFAIPFLALAVTLTSFRALFRYTGVIAKIGGWLLVVMGVLLFTNQMTLITAWIQQTTGFTGF